MRRAWPLAVLGAAALAALAWWAGGWYLQRAELEAAQADLAHGRTAAARRRFARLAEVASPTAETLRGLGDAEAAEGRIRAALDAWGRVPSTDPQAAELTRKRADLAFKHGHWAAAEDALKALQALPNHDPSRVFFQLGWLLQMQGRHDEGRKLIETSKLPPSFWGLRAAWQLDTDPVPVEAVRDAIEAAGQNAPDDDRVWIARANLALRLGELDVADRWLNACERHRPSDTSVARARLNWALAANQPARARDALERLPADSVAAAERASLRAWFASRRGDDQAERAALQEQLRLEPATTTALERLAELAQTAGESDRARELRARKAELDDIKERYRELMADPDPTPRAAEAAELAERLGRDHDARGWAAIRHRQAPGDPAVRAVLERLARREAPPAPAGRSVAALLGDEALRLPAPDGPDLETATVVRFQDEAESSGLRFTFANGRSPQRQLPETMSGGVALLDYDGDGWLDVYLVQGGTFPPPPDAPPGGRLFRNRRDGTFEDVTAAAGLNVIPGGYGHGVTVGDYDNDGDPDLFLTRWGSYLLLRNESGRFVDATGSAGLDGPRDWPTSAAFADLDNDGDLDLYVCHYLRWDAANPRACRDPVTNEIMYCSPIEQPALPDHVFRNEGGRFVDVSESAGITAIDTEGRGLGVVAAHLDEDGLIDLYVANDMTANFLWRNRGGFRFEEEAHLAGVAGNAQGGYQAGMGVAAGDLDGDGRVDLAVTNFYGEGTTYYHNLGGGFFADRTADSGLMLATRYQLGFGIAAIDAANEGRLGLVQTNGHVNEFPSLFPYAMPAQLLVNLGGGRFRDVSNHEGSPFVRPRVGRGLATGDLNNDGLVDVVIVSRNQPVDLLINRTAGQAHWLTLELEGTRSHRDAIGAIVTVVAAGREQVAQRIGGGSYQSSSGPRLHFGLGDAARVESVEVRWPHGGVDRWDGLSPNRGYRLREGERAPYALAGFRTAP